MNDKITHYASLIGPLTGLYYPLPTELNTYIQQRKALNTSKLKALWCSIYSVKEVDGQIEKFGGQKLPDRLARTLDYEHHKVFGGAG